MIDKQRIDDLVDDYLSWMESVHHDAGWHSCGLLEKLKMPAVPPRPDLKDMKMVNESNYLRREPKELGLITAALKNLHAKNIKAWLAILARRYYQHTFLEASTRRVTAYQDHHRASLVGQNLREYRHNLKRAYEILDESIGLLEIGRFLAA